MSDMAEGSAAAAADLAIHVRSLSKMFKVYPKPADLFWELVTRKPHHTEFWALRDISFDIKRGEIVGVIGRNGAGKSTLLKIVTGLMDHDGGDVEVRGKISAILELGTGFHADYTGRQNIERGGLMMGMSPAEVGRKMDSIIDFAELREVIDQPFRTYSSGMQARLTFSTAISVDPDILIIDEALAAGDALFIGKCMQRIAEICASGATVLFVTHSTNLVQRFCQRCLHLEKGRVVDFGDAFDVTSRYENLVVQEQSRQYQALSKSMQDSRAHVPAHTVDVARAFDNTSAGEASRGWRLAGEALAITAVTIRDDGSEERFSFRQHEPLRLRIECRAAVAIPNPCIFVKFRRSDGILVTTWHSQSPHHFDFGVWDVGDHYVELLMTDLLLGDGDYYVSVYVYPESPGGVPVAPAYAVEENHLCFSVRRRRPLMTVFDHPIAVTVDDKLVVPSDSVHVTWS